MAGEAWEQEKARMAQELAEARQQLSGLSNERNQYRQKVDAWERHVGAALGTMVKTDPSTGLPVGIDTGPDEPVRAPMAPVGAHPLAGLSAYDQQFNPSAVDTYYNTLFRQQGFLTQDQVQQYAAQAADQSAKRAYEAARGDMMVMRRHDQLVSQEKYKDLANPDSVLAKRTAKVLQDRQLASPLDGAKTFDQWRWRDLEALQMGADMARLELWEESQQQQHATQSGQAAGLASGGAPSTTPSGAGEAQWLEAAEQGNIAAMRQMLSDHVSSVTGRPT